MKIISSNLMEVEMLETREFSLSLITNRLKLDRKEGMKVLKKGQPTISLKKIPQSEIKLFFFSFFVSFHRNIFIVNLAISGELKILQKNLYSSGCVKTFQREILWIFNCFMGFFEAVPDFLIFFLRSGFFKQKFP